MIAVAPLVSIVTATYNRSNVLRYAIESVLRGTLTDWEMIVVGDACTDDTEAVVAGFGDPRIRFVNLPHSCGEQSGPNNTGASLAIGRYLAYLNHDDLWFPEHLARSVAKLEAGADLVFGIGLKLQGDGAPVLVGALSVEPDRPYRPNLWIPATLWVMTRDLAARVGPWTRASELRHWAPSVDWLTRAYRSGARLVGSPHLAAVVITSGDRVDSYRDRQAMEHARFARRMAEGDAMIDELVQAALTWESRRYHHQPAPFLIEGIVILGRRVLLALGLHPPMPYMWLRDWRKGALIRRLRRVRGLPPM